VFIKTKENTGSHYQARFDFPEFCLVGLPDIGCFSARIHVIEPAHVPPERLPGNQANHFRVRCCSEPTTKVSGIARNYTV
jgi:hypothetical protein